MLGTCNGLNPTADKSMVCMVFKWKRVVRWVYIHLVSNHASLTLGDFSVIKNDVGLCSLTIYITELVCQDNKLNKW